MDFKPIEYVTVSEYETLVEDEEVDDGTVYVISDAADSVDIADFVDKATLANYATNNDISILVLKSDLSNYATNADA